jgi:hypothetical protein
MRLHVSAVPKLFSGLMKLDWEGNNEKGREAIIHSRQSEF